MPSIPGKRKRKSTRQTTDERLSSGPGRTMKRAAELSISKAAVKKSRKHRVNTTAPPTDNSLSLLERLPNELIQQIFFHCFEVNLPRASLRLAQALSTESTFNALILFAFFEDDDHNPVETKLFLPVAYTKLESDARIRLQKDVLICRWFNLERLQNAMPALSILAMTQEWHKEHASETNFMNSYTDEIQANDILALHSDNLDPFLELDIVRDLAVLPKLNDLDNVCRHFFAKAYHNRPLSVEEDTVLNIGTNSEKYLPRILTWTVHTNEARSDGDPHLIKCPRYARSVLATRSFPDRLVRGNPWTSDKIGMLQLLRQGSRFPRNYPESLLDISASAIFDGIASAIKEDSGLALMTLLEIHNDVFKDENFGSFMMQPPSPRLPARLFHAATRAGAQSSKFIRLLVRACLTSIPKDDNMLTAWALKEQTKGNPIADLLLNYMSHPKDLNRHLSKFTTEINSLPPNAVRDQFLLEPSEETFHEELGYLPGCRPTGSIQVVQKAD